MRSGERFHHVARFLHQVRQELCAYIRCRRTAPGGNSSGDFGASDTGSLGPRAARLSRSEPELAELIQIQIGAALSRFAGDTHCSGGPAVRNNCGSAVAIEVSSVSLPDRVLLDQDGAGAGRRVARAVAAFLLVYETGAKIARVARAQNHDCNTVCAVVFGLITLPSLARQSNEFPATHAPKNSPAGR